MYPFELVGGTHAISESEEAQLGYHHKLNVVANKPALLARKRELCHFCHFHVEPSFAVALEQQHLFPSWLLLHVAICKSFS